MTQALLTAIKSINALSSEEKYQVWQILEQDIARVDENLTFAATKLSESAFSKIWDNPEDAEYDNL